MSGQHTCADQDACEGATDSYRARNVREVKYLRGVGRDRESAKHREMKPRVTAVSNPEAGTVILDGGKTCETQAGVLKQA